MRYSFIIVTPGRSGSEHLIETLNSYPDLQVDGEVFNRTNRNPGSFNHFLKSSWLRKGTGFLFNREKLSRLWFNFPLQVLISRFLNQKEFTQTSGFKLTLDQLYAYPFLFKKLTELTIIYLGREHLPDLVFSLIKARKSGVYSTRETNQNPEKHTLDVEEVVTLYDQLVQWEDRFFMKMKQQALLKITYESLFERYPETIRMLRSFLGLPRQDPPRISTIQKNHAGSPRNWVSNYDEICGELANRRKNRS